MKRSFPLSPASRDSRAKNQVQDLDLVWIRCKGYRCIAYRDSDGKWINFYTHEKLTDFIEVSFLDIFSGSIAGNLEFASYEVKHREQVLRGSIAPGFPLRSREQTV